MPTVTSPGSFIDGAKLFSGTQLCTLYISPTETTLSDGSMGRKVDVFGRINIMTLLRRNLSVAGANLKTHNKGIPR